MKLNNGLLGILLFFALGVISAGFVPVVAGVFYWGLCLQQGWKFGGFEVFDFFHNLLGGE